MASPYYVTWQKSDDDITTSKASINKTCDGTTNGYDTTWSGSPPTDKDPYDDTQLESTPQLQEDYYTNIHGTKERMCSPCTCKRCRWLLVWLFLALAISLIITATVTAVFHRKGTDEGNTTLTSEAREKHFDCQVSYILYENKYSPGGIYQFNVNTLDTCQARCTADLDCLALDFYSDIDGCYFHYGDIDLRDGNGVDHYYKKTCGVASARTHPLTRPGEITTTAPSPTTISTRTTPAGCAGDVAVLVDDSASLLEGGTTLNNWYLLSGFVTSLITRFNPTSKDTRLALAKFSTAAHVVHRFSDPQITGSIRYKWSQVRVALGESQLIRGLNLVRDQIFRPQFGDRPERPNVLIVVTDGRPSGSSIQQLQSAITSLTDVANPIIIPVGITNDPDERSLEILAQGSRSGHVVRPVIVRVFGGLSSNAEYIVNLSCMGIDKFAV